MFQKILIKQSPGERIFTSWELCQFLPYADFGFSLYFTFGDANVYSEYEKLLETNWFKSIFCSKGDVFYENKKIGKILSFHFHPERDEITCNWKRVGGESIYGITEELALYFLVEDDKFIGIEIANG